MTWEAPALRRGMLDHGGRETHGKPMPNGVLPPAQISEVMMPR